MKIIIKILEKSFYQLVIIYSLLVLFISTKLIFRYSYHMEIFALILALFAIISINSNILKVGDKLNNNIHYISLILALIIIFIFRIIPYFNNSIPLGYDTGIYKYIIENGLNFDKWLVSSTEPGFFYFMQFIKDYLSTDFILTYLLIIFNVILGIAIYLTTKEFFNKKIALLSIIIYSISSIQFLTFTYMYYKNIIALSLVLFSILFLRKSEKKANYLKIIYTILFILFAILTGIVHRPTFYIFGLSYLFYSFISPYDNKIRKYNFKGLICNIFNGIIILLLTLLFYLNKFKPSILVIIEPVLQGFSQPGEAPGTFISFLTYQFSTLAYLPFALIGFFYLIKNKQLNMLFFWTLITFIIVYFQFFFYNRFIIHLDIILIILSGLGSYILIENKKNLGYFILIIMLISSIFLIYDKSINTKSLINDNELDVITKFQNTEENAFVMTTSSLYSPWLIGYSNRKTIAPGLFDYNLHNREQWDNFWKTTDINYIKEFMNAYKKPLYIFIGEKQVDNLKSYQDCFITYYQNADNKIYQYIC